MRIDFRRRGIDDVKFMIVNSMLSHAQGAIGDLRSRVDTQEIPVYQDNATLNIWQQLNGRKDDIFIYDRCGRFVFMVPYPASLDIDYVNWLVTATERYNYCNCPHHTLHRQNSHRRRHQRQQVIRGQTQEQGQDQGQSSSQTASSTHQHGSHHHSSHSSNHRGHHGHHVVAKRNVDVVSFHRNRNQEYTDEQ